MSADFPDYVPDSEPETPSGDFSSGEPNATDRGSNGHDPNAGKSTPETRAAMLEAALYYASKGMQIFPSPPGTKKSYKSAKYSNGPWGKTTDPADIRRNFLKWPDANVCIAMGPDSGYFVLEVDTPKGHNVDGIASLRALEAQHSPLPETRQAISPTGSIHYYYKWPTTGTISNSASMIGPGIDIRGEGGMVVAPPSLKPGVGAYSWHNEHPAVDAPEWLLALMVDTTTKAEHTPGAEPQAEPKKIAAALAVIPNDDLGWEGKKDGEIGWNDVAMATWRATGGDNIGLAAFHAWSKKSQKYNAEATDERWKGITKYPPTSIGAGTIFKMADEIVPGWREQYERTNQPPFVVIAERHNFPDEAKMPVWDFLYGKHLLRRTVSATAAMGGTGKSSMSIVEALAITTGRPLLGVRSIFQRVEQLRVLLINLEDNREAVDKRIAAVMKHHELKPTDVGNRLFTIAKGELSFKIAKLSKSGSVERNDNAIKGMIDFLRSEKIDVFSIDPFIATHSVNENDNTSIRNVIECYDTIAEGANCGVHIWHHSRKSNGQETTIDTVRGASSFADACRSVRVLETMTKTEAKGLGIENASGYFRSFSGKLSFAPPSDKSDWFHFVNVTLNNCRLFPGEEFLGDEVGVVEAWDHPSKGGETVDLSIDEIAEVQREIASSEWREDMRADMWAGKAIASALNIDVDEKLKLKAILAKLLLTKVLKRVTRKDKTRHERAYIECVNL
jgi:hypothetical protein